MKSGRKSRSDSWYASIPDADMWGAYDACKCMRPWERAAAWIKERYNLRVSRAAYYRWLDWCRANELTHKLRDARAFAADTRRIIAEVGDVDATLQDGIAALALDAASSRDISSLGDLVNGLGKLRKQEIEDLKRKVARLEADNSALRADRESKAGARPVGDAVSVADAIDRELGVRPKGGAHG